MTKLVRHRLDEQVTRSMLNWLDSQAPGSEQPCGGPVAAECQ